jgi:hypothetical protein
MFIRLEDSSRYSTGWSLRTKEDSDDGLPYSVRAKKKAFVRSFVLFFPDLDHGPGRV